MANTITLKVMKSLLADLERQGCTIEDKTKGYFVKFPNGESTTFHKTTSDHRAVLNMRSVVRRNGCSWLLDGGKR